MKAADTVRGAPATRQQACHGSLLQALGATLSVWRPVLSTAPRNADAQQCERMFIALHGVRHDAWRLAAAARALRQPLAGLASPGRAPALRRPPPPEAQPLTTLYDVVAEGIVGTATRVG